MRCCLLTFVGLAAVAGTLALAQPAAKEAKPSQPAGQPELPPGMSAEDMQACTEAATPGPNHAHLAESVGVWTGKTTMWMSPDAPPTTSECTNTVTTFMDGRFIRSELAGDMGGMPFTGLGIAGFDNVSQTFVSTWVDNCGTGIMNGKGELSSDGKTLTWTFNYNCPITKKPAVMREVERRTGKDTMTFQMFGADPHTGKEYKMMEIAFTRKPGAGAPGTPHTGGGR